jgi:phosphomannomutase
MRDLNIGMFKAYDIRTKSELLSQEMIRRLCEAVARYCDEVLEVRSIIVAHDARLAAPKLMEQALCTFASCGFEILANPFQISTCQFYFTCSCNPEAAGMMITASHNPGNYIGLKLLAPRMQPIAMNCGPEGGLSKIKQFYLEGKTIPQNRRGQVHVINEAEHFVDYSMKLAGVGKDSLKGLSICMEFLSGTAGYDISMAMEKAGASPTYRHLVPDGNFPCGAPNPIIESSIAPEREFMRKHSFDFGFCYDGDGDRMDILDPEGKQIAPGFNMSLLMPYLLSLHHNAYLQGIFKDDPWRPCFYADVKAIPTALVAIARSGIDVHIIRNGHSFIKAKLKENYRAQYLASEEESAHYYMNFPLDPDDWHKGTVATENTLFYTLLTSRAWLERPDDYKQTIALQESLFRKREWPLHFEAAPKKMENIMNDVERAMGKRGALIIKQMDDGSDLDAVLMRFGLPRVFTADTRLSDTWCQVAQRISRSEDAMTRWEVVSNDDNLCEEMNGVIREIADRYVSAGYARYDS